MRGTWEIHGHLSDSEFDAHRNIEIVHDVETLHDGFPCGFPLRSGGLIESGPHEPGGRGNVAGKAERATSRTEG